MRQITKYLLPTLAASVLLAACGSSSSTTSSGTATKSAAAVPASSGTSVALVKTASNSTVGKTVLVDSRGMTLYTLSGEHAGKWICTSAACVKAWPPLIAKTASPPKGSVGSLATAKRPDGTVQVTYKGVPLYTFVGDQKPGEAKGQGIKDHGSTWTVESAGGASSSAPAAAAPAPAASSTTSSSHGYGY